MNAATSTAVTNPAHNTLSASIVEIPLPCPFGGKSNAILFEHYNMLGALKEKRHAALLLENFPSIVELVLKCIDKVTNDLKDHNTPSEYVASDPKGFENFIDNGLEKTAIDCESFMQQHGEDDCPPENILSFAAHYDFVSNLEALDKNFTKLLDATEQINFMCQKEDMVRQMISYLAKHGKPMLAWDTTTHKFFVETYLEKLALVKQLEALLCDIRRSVIHEQWGDAIIELFSQAGQVQGGKLYQTNEWEIYEQRETPEARASSKLWAEFMAQNYERKSRNTQ